MQEVMMCSIREIKEKFLKLKKQNKVVLNKEKPVVITLTASMHNLDYSGKHNPIAYSQSLQNLFIETTEFLIEKIGISTKFGFTYNGQIVLLLTHYSTPEGTGLWCGYDVQKMVSTVAGLATAKANKLVNKDLIISFTAEAMNVDKEDVVDYFIMVQGEVINTSILLLGRTELGKKEIQGLNNSAILEKMKEKGVLWDNYDEWQKYGTIITKNKKCFAGTSYQHNSFTINSNLEKINKYI